MLLDRDIQVIGSTVMEEEDTLADAPQRRGSEFVAIGTALRDTVRQSASHVMYGKITVGLNRNVALSRGLRLCGGKGFGMASLAADVGEDLASARG